MLANQISGSPVCQNKRPMAIEECRYILEVFGVVVMFDRVSGAYKWVDRFARRLQPWIVILNSSLLHFSSTSWFWKRRKLLPRMFAGRKYTRREVSGGGGSWNH